MLLDKSRCVTWWVSWGYMEGGMQHGGAHWPVGCMGIWGAQVGRANRVWRAVTTTTYLLIGVESHFLV